MEAVARHLAKERDLDGIDTSNIVSGGRRRQPVQAPRTYKCVVASALDWKAWWLALLGLEVCNYPGARLLTLQRPLLCRAASDSEDSSSSEEDPESDSDGVQGLPSAMHLSMDTWCGCNTGPAVTQGIPANKTHLRISPKPGQDLGTPT